MGLKPGGAERGLRPPLPTTSLPYQGSMKTSTKAVKKRTTQEQLKAAPLCFSFSTE